MMARFVNFITHLDVCLIFLPAASAAAGLHLTFSKEELLASGYASGYAIGCAIDFLAPRCFIWLIITLIN